MKNVTITISGRACSGKAIIAEIIYHALRAAGFDNVKGVKRSDLFDLLTTLRRIRDISSRTVILIKEIQTRRDPYIPEDETVQEEADRETDCEP